MKEFLIGVDEAGRGPLAGPVSVGIVAVPYDFDIKTAFPGVADSKVLSETKRELLFERLLELQAEKVVSYTIVFASAETIDREGITKAVLDSIYRGVRELAPDAATVREVLLDGLLKAPPEYAQQTIIRGDATEPVISLASIAAKVSRDRFMKDLAGKFPEYGFAQHKGYGTRAHIEAIATHGLCEIHRRSFCRSL
ncbi:MAG TPA: ribonuclease HII [Candidatus Paceibacterota bacterium]|nr:ribonuclease HII [Candidatus Paceibacterota bacterium]